MERNITALRRPRENSRERPSSSDAPELDKGSDAPQHYPLQDGLKPKLSDAPEPATATDCLEPHPDDLHPKEASSIHPVKHVNPLSRIRSRVLISVYPLIGVLAVSLGVGLGIGLPRAQPQLLPSQNISASSLPPRTGALNDTSLSAVLTADGNRHLFFQDINGSLRHAVYSQSFSSWSESVDVIPTDRQPRLHTPLSAIQAKLAVVATFFNIYYIDLEDKLAAIQYGSEFSNQSSSMQLMNDSFLASTTGRSLSVTNISMVEATASNSSESSSAGLEYLQSVLLFYSGPREELQVLCGNSFDNWTYDESHNSITMENYIWKWQKVNLNVTQVPGGQDDDVSGYKLGRPFALTRSGSSLVGHFMATDTDNSTHMLRTGVDNLVSTAEGRLYQDIFLQNGTYHHNFTSSSLQLQSSTALVFDAAGHLRDWASPMPDGDDFGLLVGAANAFVFNKSVFTTNTGPISNKNFSFGRLGFISGNESAFLYHQLNESILLEEIQDVPSGTAGFGKTNIITIPIQ